jgi:hypothetical protein
MKQEDKELLLKYLCAMLPYNPVVHIKDINVCYYDNYLCEDYLAKFRVNSIIIMPYLRPMSSMTEEEEEEFVLLTDIMLRYGKNNNLCCLPLDAIQWLLKKHFDFMGLIPKGLAIEVTEENNPYKE